MTEASCVRCGRPIHDTAYIDTACEAHLRRALEDVVRIAGDITLTVARLSKVRRRGSADMEREWYRGDGALYPTPMLVDLDKANRHDAAVGELTTWARHIADTRGIVLAPKRHRLACDHSSCAVIRLDAKYSRRQTMAGPLCDPPPPAMHDLAVAAGFVAANLGWLRYRQEAEEAWPALLSACHTLERVVDTAAGEVIVGRCPCEHWLYAVEGASFVRCWGCGTSYDVATSRDALKADLEDRLMTGAEIAKLAGYLGVADSRKARLMIQVWAQREKLARWRLWTVDKGGTVVDVESIFRFGDALPLLMVAYAKAA